MNVPFKSNVLLLKYGTWETSYTKLMTRELFRQRARRELSNQEAIKTKPLTTVVVYKTSTSGNANAILPIKAKLLEGFISWRNTAFRSGNIFCISVSV